MSSTLAWQQRHWSRIGEIGFLLGAVLLLWQALHYVAGDTALTAPADTIYFAFLLVLSPDFWSHLLATGQAFLIAFAIVAVSGPLLGALLGLNRLTGDVMEPILVSIYSVPKVVLYPVVLLVFGIGLGAEIAFGVFHGIVPAILFTMNAVRNIKPVLIKTGRVLRLSKWTLVRSILFPAALPEIFSGLRVGFSVTLLGTIMSEMFGARRGLGYLLMNALGYNNVRMILSIALLMALFATTMNTILMIIEKRLHHQQ